MDKQPLTRERFLGNIRFECNFNRVIILIFLLLACQFFTMVLVLHRSFLVIESVLVTFAVIMLIMCNVWHRRFGTYAIGQNGDLVRAQAIWLAIRENFQRAEFNSASQIPEEVVRFPGFSFTRDHWTYRPEHYATAMWGTIPMELQYMTVGSIKSYANLSQSGTEAATYSALDPSFKGMLYLCHLGRPFTPTIVHTGKPQAGEIKTGDAAFDRIFSVRTRDPRTMPLSAGMRRFLTEAVGNFKGKVYIHFAGNGDVYVAFHQKLYVSTPLMNPRSLEKLDRQAYVVQGILSGLTRGF